jgi:deazaflavin-dependent oxidoreductase (nitroreductase family)
MNGHKLDAPGAIARSPRLRRLVRALARLLNPLVLSIAGRRWMPIVGVIHHRGRRTGRAYATPLGMRELDGRYYVPRTFGDHAAWHLNLVAAGAVDATYLGRRRRLVLAATADLRQAAPAFPVYERALFSLLGIDDFAVLTEEEPAGVQTAA